MTDVDSLTIGQAKQLLAMLGGHFGDSAKVSATENQSSVHSRNVGKYVIVRSRNEGINAGIIVAADETGIVLSNARRVWYHRPADDTAWYEGVANSGLRSDSKVSAEVKEKVIVEDYSITICTSEAEKSIRGFKAHAQS